MLDIMKAMLSFGSTSRIAAGLKLGQFGSTGLVGGTGVHTHLSAMRSGNAIAPTKLFEALGIPISYKDRGVLLTGLKTKDYADPELLKQIQA